MSINAPGRAARAYRRDLDPAFVPVVVVVVDFSPVPWGNGGGGERARRGRSTGRAVRFFALRGVRARAHHPRAFSRVPLFEAF